MTMTWDWWIYFIYVGPTSIWLLGGAILYTSYRANKNTLRVAAAVRHTAEELSKATQAITTATSELIGDTQKLTGSLATLHQGNALLYEETKRLNQNMQQVFNPFGWMQGMTKR